MSDNNKYYVPNKLSYEKLAALPVISPEMSAEERRQLCIEFFYLTNTFEWTPKSSFDYIIESSMSLRQIRTGKLYGGLCYAACSRGNAYRILDYYDTETGVLDLKTAFEKEQLLIGCQCSGGVHWAWSRIQCSTWFEGCADMVEKNGCRKLGSYQYDPELKEFTTEYGTGDICEENGRQVMYEAYALVRPADCLVYFTTAGHVVMARTKAWVVRNEDGTIDGSNSHIFILDQAQKVKHSPSTNGDEFLHMANHRREMTFELLFEQRYIPITLDAFDEDYKAETPWINISLSGETVSVQDLKSAVVTSNYALSDVYVIVEDKDGKELYRDVVRTENLFQRSLCAEKAVAEEAFAAFAGKTVKVLCQSATGIRKVIYSGTLK